MSNSLNVPNNGRRLLRPNDNEGRGARCVPLHGLLAFRNILTDPPVDAGRIDTGEIAQAPGPRFKSPGWVA